MANNKRALWELLESDSDDVDEATASKAAVHAEDGRSVQASEPKKQKMKPESKWWGDILKDRLEEERSRIGKQTKPYRIHHGCAGTNSPLYALQVLEQSFAC